MISSDIPDLPPPLPTLPLPDDDEDEVDRSTRSRDSHSQEASSVRDSASASPAQNTIAIPNTERLIGAGPAVKSMTVERREEDRTDANNIPPLPEALEQKIMINKDAETLGVQVDIEEGRVNGMLVRSVTLGGTLARDVRGGRGDPGGGGGAAEVAVPVPGQEGRHHHQHQSRRPGDPPDLIPARRPPACAGAPGVALRPLHQCHGKRPKLREDQPKVRHHGRELHGP